MAPGLGVRMADESAKSGTGSQPVVFALRLGGSELFRSLFKEGMALVEQTADYLDGDGRGESRRLSRSGSLAYATESIRLTTRLMQLASWLLLQRAVNDGEISSEQARLERSKVKLASLATATEGSGWDALPEKLKSLISRSLRLQERIRRLDGATGPEARAAAENPVRRQIGLIAEAFNAVVK
jgi:regulator of CtrA degradation